MKKRFLIIFTSLILPLYVKAQEGVLDGLDCVKDGSCGLEEVEQGFALLTSRLVGLIGAAALLFLIYGGLKWLTSGGKQDSITAGKNIIIGSITAIIIALLAGVLVRFYTEELFKVKQHTVVAPQAQEEGPE